VKVFNNSWNEIFAKEWEKTYFENLLKFIDSEYKNKVIYPPKEEIFNAFKLTDFKDIKVVILGQDPYHGPGQAHGLAFSVKSGMKMPPSLNNIFKELASDLHIPKPINTDLSKWAKEGVLLLNTVLTVREKSPKSHENIGWERFTDFIIKTINDRKDKIVFLLWGNNAKSKAKLITNKTHLILTAPHPSPLSAYQGFFGCKHFSKANKFLKANKKAEIDWNI